MNDAGVIVGWSRIGDIFGRYHAFRYFEDGPMQDLGTLHSEGLSEAHAVNDAGVIVGGATVPGGTIHIFRYGGDGPMEDLGMLAGSYGSTARDVNESGEIAGTALMAPGQVGNDHAIRRRLDGTIIDLGTLGGDISEALAIHDGGVIVGSAEIPNQSRRATLWRTDDSIVNLDEWLDVVNPGEGAKWLLTDAFDINIHGQVAGRGFYDDGPGGLDDGQTGFVLDAGSFIPEPTSVGALILGGVLSLLQRVNQSR